MKVNWRRLAVLCFIGLFIGSVVGIYFDPLLSYFISGAIGGIAGVFFSIKYPIFS